MQHQQGPSTTLAPPQLTARQRRRLKKLDAILDAAEQLLMQVGLDGLTMAKLAAEVDVTAGALYRYFTGKEQMFVQLQVRALREVNEAFDERLALLRGRADHKLSSVATLAAVLAVGDVHSHFAITKPSRFGLLAIGLAEQRDLVGAGGSTEVWRGVDALLWRVAELLDAASASGALETGDSRRRAVMLTMGGQGMLQLAKMARHLPDLPPMQSLSADLFESLLFSWGADRETLKRARAMSKG